MVCGETAEIDADLLEQFLAGVVAFESAPKRPLTQLLAESGFDLPPARQLSGPALRRTLRAVIRRLAEWRYYLVHTDHLSDRDLYTVLREDVLPQPDNELPPESAASMVFDLSFFSDRGQQHTDPPFNRDRRLPAPEPGPMILATPGGPLRA